MSRKLAFVALATATLFGGVCIETSCARPSARLREGRAPRTARSEITPPACTRTVPAGGDVQGALDTEKDGGVVCLGAGVHMGPLVIRHPLTLYGARDAIVKSPGEGTTIEVLSSRAGVLGLTIEGSGGRFDLLDAAVHVHGEDVRVEGLDIHRAVFGISVDQSKRVRVVNNQIQGTEEGTIGLRGDPIRLWETSDSVITDNRVTAGRDVVVWYSSGNRIENNVVSEGRYGTHFMYSHRNFVANNRYERDVVGIFVMYSRDLQIRQNRFLHAEGAAGMGLGLKESGNIVVEDNAFVHNTTAVFMDTSPLGNDDHNSFSRNLFALGQVGIDFHSSETRNTFYDNAFNGNLEHVRVDGNGDARGVDWRGNYFDDYAGYDLDGDGFGDVPHEIRRLSGDLVQRRPELEFLNGTPALWLADAISHVAPLFPPRKLLSDARPRMESSLVRLPAEEEP